MDTVAGALFGGRSCTVGTRVVLFLVNKFAQRNAKQFLKKQKIGNNWTQTNLWKLRGLWSPEGSEKNPLPGGRRGEKWTEAVDAASPKERRRASLTKSRGQGRRRRRGHAEEGR